MLWRSGGAALGVTVAHVLPMVSGAWPIAAALGVTANLPSACRPTVVVCRRVATDAPMAKGRAP